MRLYVNNRCSVGFFLFIGLSALGFRSVTQILRKRNLSFSKDDVEKCKQKDLLEQMMAEMIGEFPDLHRTIVSERDIYLTYMLKQAAKQIELPRASESNCFKANTLISVFFVCCYISQLFVGRLWGSVCLSKTDAAYHRRLQCLKS